MKPEYVNVVTIMHQNCPGRFTFRVPAGVKLDVGDYVLVETKNNPCEFGICITPSFIIGDWQLEKFYKIKKKDLKPVIGILHPEMFIVESAVDDE